MADTSTPMTLSFRSVLFTVLIITLTVLSFHGTFDQFASDQVDKTTVESVGLYALSRLINAGISVLQTAGINAIVNVEIGQIFDPINDAIERLSTALVWAIGSLFLQGIILKIAASELFKWAFLISAVIVMILFLPIGSDRTALLYSRITGVSEGVIRRWQYFFLKVFIISSLVRFIVPVFIGGSFLFSQLVLQPDLDREQKQLKELESELQELKNEVSIGSEFKPRSVEELLREKVEVNSDLASMKNDRSSLQAQRDAIAQKIADQEKKAGLDRFWPEWLGGKPPGEKLKALRSKRADLESQIDTTDDQIKDKEAVSACIDQQIEGKSCASWLKQVIGIGKAGLERIYASAEAISEASIAVARILMAIFAKNILFPLVFLVIALKCGQAIGRCALQLAGGNLKQDVVRPEADARRIGRGNDGA